MLENSTVPVQDKTCMEHNFCKKEDSYLKSDQNNTSFFSRRKGRRKKIMSLLFCLLTIFIVLVLVKYMDFDLVLQEHFYNRATHQWWITPENHAHLTYFFYKGAKIFVGALGGLAALGVLSGFVYKRIQKYRKPLFILALSIFLVPAVVGGIKQATNIYTPMQLTLYDGNKPYYPVLSQHLHKAPSDKKGLGFPAGHATTGFALMSLYFCFRKRQLRYLGLGLGISLGWILGLYQTFRGEHFLSHTIVSMFTAWIIIVLVELIVSRYLPE